MKPIRSMIAMVWLFAIMTTILANPKGEASKEENTLQVFYAPALGDLAHSISAAFQKEYPEIPVRFTPMTDEGMKKMVGQEGMIALVEKGGLSGMGTGASWKMVVGREAIVPVMNTANPFRETILKQGISMQGFNRIYDGSGRLTWGELLGTGDQTPILAFAPGEPASRAYLAEFVQSDPLLLGGQEILEPGKMLDRIAANRSAIGFCPLGTLLMMEEQGKDPGVSLVPVDVNGNSQMDYFENIYRSGSDLSHGIYIGKYPASLYSRIYAVAAEPPAGENARVFLEWMVTAGQDLLAEGGLVPVGYSERNAGLQKVSGLEPSVAEPPGATPYRSILLVLVGSLLILVILGWRFTRGSGKGVTKTLKKGVKREGVFGEEPVTFPGGLFFDRSHTWAFMEKDGIVRIGLDDFMQHVTGPVTRIVMKEKGEKVVKGEPFLKLIQDGKQLEICSPLSGIIQEKNSNLYTDSSMLNSAPYGEGWVYQVEPVNWLTELKAFFMGDHYRTWLKTEFARLKEFLSSDLNIKDGNELSLVMQDGGEIVDGVLAWFGPEVWEDFQIRFINRSRS
jgi:glycine cleavage system H lipoate-binding protein/ABC-type phosphate transport system substrate-binding protein